MPWRSLIVYWSTLSIVRFCCHENEREKMEILEILSLNYQSEKKWIDILCSYLHILVCKSRLLCKLKVLTLTQRWPWPGNLKKQQHRYGTLLCRHVHVANRCCVFCRRLVVPGIHCLQPDFLWWLEIQLQQSKLYICGCFILPVFKVLGDII